MTMNSYKNPLINPIPKEIITVLEHTFTTKVYLKTTDENNQEKLEEVPVMVYEKIGLNSSANNGQQKLVVKWGASPLVLGDLTFMESNKNLYIDSKELTVFNENFVDLDALLIEAAVAKSVKLGHGGRVLLSTHECSWKHFHNQFNFSIICTEEMKYILAEYETENEVEINNFDNQNILKTVCSAYLSDPENEIMLRLSDEEIKKKRLQYGLLPKNILAEAVIQDDTINNNNTNSSAIPVIDLTPATPLLQELLACLVHTFALLLSKQFDKTLIEAKKIKISEFIFGSNQKGGSLWSIIQEIAKALKPSLDIKKMHHLAWPKLIEEINDINLQPQSILALCHVHFKVVRYLQMDAQVEIKNLDTIHVVCDLLKRINFDICEISQTLYRLNLSAIQFKIEEHKFDLHGGFGKPIEYYRGEQKFTKKVSNTIVDIYKNVSRLLNLDQITEKDYLECLKSIIESLDGKLVVKLSLLGGTDPSRVELHQYIMDVIHNHPVAKSGLVTKVAPNFQGSQ